MPTPPHSTEDQAPLTPPSSHEELSAPGADSNASQAKIAGLLQSVDEASSQLGKSSDGLLQAHSRQQQALVESRLGMASALFASLRYKHPATAAHSFRVALRCSCWAAALEMPNKLRVQLEAAALLHDIGKIGVPDQVLLKPGRLEASELEQVDAARGHAREILKSAGAPPAVIEGVVTAGAWYDGSHRSLKLAAADTPVIARMIAIADAFDSMTTDQVYRPARSRERAIATLFECAGTQFDPDLVNSFSELFQADTQSLEEEVSKRWISQVGEADPAAAWRPPLSVEQVAKPADGQEPFADRFMLELVDNMHDAVAFVDKNLRITRWNTGAERMTGIGASAALGTEFKPSLLCMMTSTGETVHDDECPVLNVMVTGLQALEHVSFIGRNGKKISAHLHVIPVLQEPGVVEGAAVLMRNVSNEASLEEHCRELRSAMTKDPMTQVANRAEFDRMLEAFIDAHQGIGLPCSLIMADIDRFKSINDTYGHQAGDEAIMAFAGILKAMCRSGDLVARYGGEEFAVLCADCNNATAAQRAEEIRRKLASTTHASIGNNRFTASFGVTELQPGDTPETLLRRADRGLLMAKDQGRNQVIQLGDGMSGSGKQSSSWLSFSKWFGGFPSGESLVESCLVTNVPIAIAVEKLRGFIADHEAEIVKASENHLQVAVVDHPPRNRRNSKERTVTLLVDMHLSQEHVERSNTAGMASGKYVQTTIETKIQPRRDRDRSGGRAVERAQKLLGSLKAYLMAKETEPEAV